MRWVVGIDLERHCLGALHVAQWLRTHRIPAVDEDFVGIHVVDEHIRTSLPVDRLAGVLTEIRAAIGRIADAADASSLSDLRVVLATTPEEGLAEAATTAGFVGVVLGRQAGRAGSGFVRLGRVARRLLRRLPCATMIVPPDLERAQIGAGPILFATDLHADAAPAGRFASTLADAVRRPFAAVHVVPTPPALAYVAEGIDVPPPQARTAPDELASWCDVHGLAPASSTVLQGDRVERVLAHARDEDAAMIVCGARQLVGPERWFSASTAAELAALADRPVVVVPSR